MKANDKRELMHDERARFVALYGRREGVVSQGNFGQSPEAYPEMHEKKGLSDLLSHEALTDDPLTSYTKQIPNSYLVACEAERVRSGGNE